MGNLENMRAHRRSLPTWRLLFVALVAAAWLPDAALGGERTISAGQLYDRLHGMWMGQLIGNAAGRATEGRYSGAQADPCESVAWQIKQVWDADDDTDIEYVALHTLLTHGFDCNAAEITGQWLEHITNDGIYVANKQAWHLMLDGYLPPETGSRAYNQHWYSIDAQIGTEVLGAVSPGMPQVAADLAGRFGAITNDGFAVHAAQFYAVMYASAFFEPNIVELVIAGLDAIPAGSRTAQVVADVLDWYEQDLLDGPLDWRAARGNLYEKYQGADSFGRYYNWVESTINTGATVLALLYGGGDFKQTVQIAVLAGWDCDCNPATAGGLLGIVHGFSGLPADLTDPNLCGDVYENVSRPGLPDANAPLPQYSTITAIALDMLALAEENILRNDGTAAGDGDARTYAIGECELAPDDPEIGEATEPAGLVAEALAASIDVTATASVSYYDQSRDRYNLDSIIDGVMDNSFNGRRPYYTYAGDSATRPERDWYELAFARPVRFNGATFYEGDIVWKTLNTYYADDEPLGGFFEDLTVQVLRNGEYVEPAGVEMSAPLDRLHMYQTIAFTFAPTVGRAMRIIGTPGGSKHFTTILELEVQGELYAGPRVETVLIGDGQVPHTEVSIIVIGFDEPVIIEAQDIELAGDSGPIDMAGVLLFRTSPCRFVLLVLPEPLPAGAYELRLRCPAILDDFGLPLVDDDDIPDDSLRTTAFEVTAPDPNTL